MSPHAVPGSPSPTDDDALVNWETEFCITKNAFLPAKRPLAVLPDPYYAPWEDVAQNLPALINNGSIRAHIRRLPLLSAHRLLSEPEWRRAYTMLAFMTHAYIWGGDKAEEVLPPQISVPFLEIAQHLELPPVLTYAAANLWNFTTASSGSDDVDDEDDFTDPEKLRLCFSFTGTVSESWFLLISVAMEARAGNILHTVAAALECVRCHDLPGVTRGLVALRNCIEAVDGLLARMNERCDPTIFYHRIRPFLAGSRGMAAAGLPRGVFYDDGTGTGTWHHLRGGSNGQSSLIQFFDLVLGVDHSASAGGGSFHREVREYMPGPHRRFLLHMARRGSIRELVMATKLPLPGAAAKEESSSCQQQQQQALQTAYTAAIDALTSFRQTHIAIVTRYIIIPSHEEPFQAQTQEQRRRWNPASRSEPPDQSVSVQSPLPPPPSPSPPSPQNLASASTAARHDHQLVGTGGTALVPFLRKARDETALAGKLLDRII